jgi:hypothetical protein
MVKAVFAGLILFLLLAGCGGSRKGIGGDDASNKVKPLKQIDINDVYTSANLIVRARNIADFSYSNKNRFELFVNDKLIRPKNSVDNATPNYNYELKLQPGYYKVNGNYYWHDGWRERKTKIQAKELVRVGQDRQTVLDIEIPKDWRGIVTEDDLSFYVSYKSFFEEETVEETAQEAAQPVKTEVEKVRLQINTDPSYCDVIIDDRMVGQTPVSVWVDNSTNHVLQLRKENYRSIMRILDVEELQSNEKIIFIDRLELLTPFITNTIPQQGSSNNLPLNGNLSTSDSSARQSTQQIANTEGESNPSSSDENSPPLQAQQPVTSENNSSDDNPPSSEGTGEEIPPQQAAQPANNPGADTTNTTGALSADTTSVASPN